MDHSTSKYSNNLLNVASWNVNKIYNANKLLDILKKLDDYKIDIAFLQETKMLDESEVKYKNYTLYFTNTNHEQPRKCLHGVAIAVRNTLKCGSLVVPVSSAVSDRIMHFYIYFERYAIHFINIYAPVKNKTNMKVSTFYEHLQRTFSHVPENDYVFLIGDFNAVIGHDNHCLEEFYINDRSNSNGNRLIDFCQKNNLDIANLRNKKEKNERLTCFNIPTNTWSEIDFILTREKNRNLVEDMYTYSALGTSDHFIVVSTLAINIPRHVDKTPEMHINISKFLIYISSEHLAPKGGIRDNLDVLVNWDDLRQWIEGFYGFSHNLSNKLLELHFEMRDTFKKLREDGELKFPLKETASLIEDCLKSLMKTEMQCTEKERKVIIDFLKKIVFRKEQGDVFVNDNVFTVSFDMLPTLKEVKLAIHIFDKTYEYTFLTSAIHSLVTAVWKNGHVPIELTMCIAEVFCSEEPKWKNVVDTIHNAILQILKERLQKEIESRIEVQPLSRKSLQDPYRYRYKITVDVINSSAFEIQPITYEVLRFLTSCGLPGSMFNLISYFTITETKSNLTLLTNCLLNLSISILCISIFGKQEWHSSVKKLPPEENQNKETTRAVCCTDGIVIVSYSVKQLYILQRMLFQLMEEFMPFVCNNISITTNFWPDGKLNVTVFEEP